MEGGKAEKLILQYSQTSVPVGLLAVVASVKDGVTVTLVPKKDNAAIELNIPSANITLKGANTIARYLARRLPKSGLYGKSLDDPLQTSEVDQWVDYTAEISSSAALDVAVGHLNFYLQLRTVLSGYTITIADILVWGALKKHAAWEKFSTEYAKSFPHLFRWLSFVESNAQIAETLQQHFGNTRAVAKGEDKQASSRMGAQGNFMSLGLQNAKEGEVVTRFPPEPSGYLHIGHAKAALMNNYYATYYKGKIIIRFDDTNPSKEKDEYVQSILEDLKKLNIVGSHVSYTSDFFPQLFQYAEQLIKEGNAFVDMTPVEQMRAERFDGIESKYRNQSIEENLRLWKEMIAGSEEGQKCVLRGKISMSDPNKCLRDPALARCNLTPHHRTGTKYKCYPLYDFACPIVDSIEGVTHALRSSEYHDRNPLYDWVTRIVRIRSPFIEDFSRLNFSYTLLSKRKLQWFVDTGKVSGWNDARFPTIQGLLRRGLTVEALTEFILSQGASKNLNLMDIEKLWAVNKKIIDPIVPRYTAIASDIKAVFELSNGPEPSINKSVPRHKKNEALGNKILTYSKRIIMEAADAKTLEKGEEITLMDWGNAIVEEVATNADGSILIKGRLNPEGSVKDTKKKLNWLPEITDLVTVTLQEFGNLITKKKPEEDDKIEDIVNPDSKIETAAVGDSNLRALAKGDRLQLERRGYFICDEPYINSGKPMVLIMIPDGHTTKEISTLAAKPAKAAKAPATKA